MKLRDIFFVFVSALSAGGNMARAEEGTLDALVRNSPFGAPATDVATPASAPSLEFRGYYSEGKEQFFSIYDPNRKRSFWLRGGQKEGTLGVVRFDTDRQNLSVEYQGRPMSLPLKSVTVRSHAVAAPEVAPVPASAPDPALTGPVSDEVRRAEQNLLRARQRTALENRQKQQRARQAQPAAPATK